MKAFKIPAAVVLAIVLVLAGTAFLSRAADDKAPESGSNAGAAPEPPPPLTAEMLARIEKDGTHIEVDAGGSDAGPETLAKVVEVAVGSLHFLDEDQVVAASLGVVSVDQLVRIKRAKLWVVYLTNVQVPNYGGTGDEEPGYGDMFVLVDPQTMRGTFASTL
jgi:ABC-type phosphate transport system substrate-binding protein